MSVEAQFPKTISLVGNYQINGRMFVLPIVGKGKFKFDMGKVDY